MTDQEQLEADFKMYQEALDDLVNNGADPEVIKQLQLKKDRAAQAINQLPKTKTKKKCFFTS